MRLASSRYLSINPLTPNDHYSGRTAPLTSKRCILYIYSTNSVTEYFKHGIYAPFFFFSSSKCSLFHNSNVFGSCFIHIFYTGCAKIFKNNSGAKRLINVRGTPQQFNERQQATTKFLNISSLYSLPDIVRAIASGNMKCEQHPTCSGRRDICRVWVGEPEDRGVGKEERSSPRSHHESI